MTFAELTTPFEKKRVIEYGHDGNKAVYHWRSMQLIGGTLYKGENVEDEFNGPVFDVYAFFDAIGMGIKVANGISRPDQRDIEPWLSDAKKYGWDSVESFMNQLDSAVERGLFIGNALIELARHVDIEKAKKYEEARQLYYEKKHQKEALRRAEENAKAAQEAKDAQDKKDAEKTKLLGWADGMTELRFGKVMATLGVLVRVDGKVIPKYQFVINAVNDGWVPDKRDDVVTYYGSRWEPKKSKPRTEYRMKRDNLVYKVTKTEFDFATYLVQNKVAA